MERTLEAELECKGLVHSSSSQGNLLYSSFINYLPKNEINLNHRLIPIFLALASNPHVHRPYFLSQPLKDLKFHGTFDSAQTHL